MELKKYHFYKFVRDLEITRIPIQYYPNGISNGVYTTTYNTNLYNYSFINGSLTTYMVNNFTIGNTYYCCRDNCLYNNSMMIEFIEDNNLDKFVESDILLNETSLNFLKRQEGNIDVKFDVNYGNFVWVSLTRATKLGVCSSICIGDLESIDDMLYQCYLELKKDYYSKLQKVLLDKRR